MLVKGCDLGGLPHATIPLLDHLGVGNQPVKGNVHPLGTDDLGQQSVQGNHKTANGVRSVQIPMEEAVEVNAQKIHLQWTLALGLNVLVFAD
jgi:hypothetical protein